MWRIALSCCAVLGCKSLPEHTPDAPFNACGNAQVDEAELCETTGARRPEPWLLGGRCDRCQFTCSPQDGCPPSLGCHESGRCQFVTGFTLTWTGALAGSDFELGDIDGDQVLDLVGADSVGVHVRRGDGSGLFGEPIDIAFRDVRSGPIVIADFDRDGVVDIAVLVGANADAIDVMRFDGGTATVTATLPLQSGERVLGMAAGRFNTSLRDLVVLLETPAGRVLRRYPGRAGALYQASDAVDMSHAMLASIAEPVVWTVTARDLTSDALAVAGAPLTPFSLLWMYPLSNGLVISPGGYVTGSPPRMLVGSALPTLDDGSVAPIVAYTNEMNGASILRFATARSSEALGGAQTTQASGVLAWLAHPSGLAGTVAVARRGTFAFGFEGYVLQPVETALMHSPTAIRSGDLDRDGLADVVIRSRSDTDAFLSRGHITP